MTVSVEKVVAAYLKLRRKKEQINTEVKIELADISAKMAKFEAFLMAKAEEDGVTSFRTADGTAFLTTTDYATVSDWDATLAFITENEAWDMLDKRVSKLAVKAYMEETSQPVPGVKYGSRVGINVRKASGD